VRVGGERKGTGEGAGGEMVQTMYAHMNKHILINFKNKLFI
jgi:hypothetical protein